MKSDEDLVRCVDMSLVGFLSSEMFDGCTYWEPLDAPRFCKKQVTMIKNGICW